MGFWNVASGAEPKRQYRWILAVQGIDQYIVSKVTKPSFTISDVGHKFLNHTYYFPGKVEWEKVSVTLVDPVQPDAAGTIMAMIQASGYEPPQTDQDLKTVAKNKATTALGEVQIKQKDADGNDIEIWKLHGAWISSVKFGELSYEEDGLTNIELELRYDYAYVEVAHSINDKANVGGTLKGGKVFPSNAAGSSIGGQILEAAGFPD